MTLPPILRSPDVIAEFESDWPILVVAFASLAGRMGGIPPFEFMRSLAKLDTKRVFVRDAGSVWYQRGIASAGSIDELAAGLAELARASAARRVVFLGASAGGYAAILFSVLVAAHEALAFGPQTFIDPVRREAIGDLRWPNVTRQLSSCLSPGYADLRPMLDRQPDSSVHPRIRLHYSADSKLDAMHAEHLAGAPAVELVAHPGAAHGLPGRLKRLGQLDAIIAQSVFGSSPGPGPT